MPLVGQVKGKALWLGSGSFNLEYVTFSNWSWDGLFLLLRTWKILHIHAWWMVTGNHIEPPVVFVVLYLQSGYKGWKHRRIYIINGLLILHYNTWYVQWHYMIYSMCCPWLAMHSSMRCAKLQKKKKLSVSRLYGHSVYVVPSKMIGHQNNFSSPLILVEMLLSILKTYAAIILIVSLLLKCSLPTALYKYSDDCSQQSRTNRLVLDKCDLIKITVRVT
jgi:hypothetical protein